MKTLILIIAIILLSGCSHYAERFTYIDPASGNTNHVVSVTHTTFLMGGEAAKLKTETQTMEFIRTVNAEGISQRPDSESIKAITAGVVEGLKIGAGVP